MTYAVNYIKKIDLKSMLNIVEMDVGVFADV